MALIDLQNIFRFFHKISRVIYEHIKLILIKCINNIFYVTVDFISYAFKIIVAFRCH